MMVKVVVVGCCGGDGNDDCDGDGNDDAHF